MHILRFLGPTGLINTKKLRGRLSLHASGHKSMAAGPATARFELEPGQLLTL